MRYQNIDAQTTVKKALSQICGWCYIYIDVPPALIGGWLYQNVDIGEVKNVVCDGKDSVDTEKYRKI